jgi:hypothetical protein
MPIHSNISSSDSITPSTNHLTGSLQTIFEHSDYNVIVNNIAGARNSSYYFDLDYSYNTFLPVNLLLVLSGSSAVATVQDSNYTTRRIISSRYVGSRNTSARYNYYTPSSDSASFEDGTIGVWSGDKSYGQTAAIDLHTNYFAVFEEVEDAFPKKSLGSKILISKLIDKDGNVIPLDSRNTHLFDVSQIFHPDKKAYVYYTEVPSGSSLSSIQNVLTKSVDEAGFLYTNLAFYKPSQTTGSTPGQPFLHQEDNRIYYSLLDTLNVSGVYVDREAYGYNNLIAQNNVVDPNRLYFYYGVPSTSSQAISPFQSTGYFLGMGLILRNFYPNTGEQYDNYRNYPWVRFEHISGGEQNYNIDINTDLLPLQIGDRFRIYDATEAMFHEVYAYDKDVFFIQNATGSTVQYTMYDSEITDIQFTLPQTINILTGTGTASILNENLFIGSDTASIYSTTDRFSTIGNIVPSQSVTRILPAYDRNNLAIDITPGAFVPGLHDESLGYGIQFKKVYRLNNIYVFHNTGTKYPFWAIGPSGSLYRSDSTLKWKQVPLPNIPPNIELHSLCFYPDSVFANNPAISATAWTGAVERGILMVCGDSGTIYYSIDFGNTFQQANFPRTDIHLYDIMMDSYLPFTTALYKDYIYTVGTSGSIYYTSASWQLFGLNSSWDTNWVNAYDYNNYIWDPNNASTIAFPTGYKRESLTFQRILPIWSSYDPSAYPSGYKHQTGFAILSNSGSIFTTMMKDEDAIFANNRTNSPFQFQLRALSGSRINTVAGVGGTQLFTVNNNFVDGVITGSGLNVYSTTANVQDSSNAIKALFLDKNGNLFLNSNMITSSFPDVFSNLTPLSYSLSQVITNSPNAPFNEIRILNTINYNTQQLENQLWIPTSAGKILSASMQTGLTAGAQTWAVVNPQLFFNYTSNSLHQLLPHTNFYSMIDANQYNPYNPFNSIYVQLTFRDSFNQPQFYNTVGSSVFPYGINPGFPNYVQSGDYTGTRQAFRLYRRYSNEQYVLTKEFVNDGKGFLIPENYNPNLNYIELAKKAGLLI